MEFHIIIFNTYHNSPGVAGQAIPLLALVLNYGSVDRGHSDDTCTNESGDLYIRSYMCSDSMVVVLRSNGNSCQNMEPLE